MRSKCTWILTLFLALTMNFSFAQEKTVTGTVTEATGPLPGLNVVVKNTNRGVQTDINGTYSIRVSPGEVLEFSYIGFKTREVTVGASNVINVVMELESDVLKEVVIQGAYQNITTNKRNVAAITTISSEMIEERANANVLQSLQGTVAGLNLSTGSGQPGADTTIILRGVGSINGNIEPLFIVDGIPVDEDGFRSINPNDIDTFSILKDASATSIYGNRGANGVILITTKRGRFNEGLRFKYTSQYGETKLQKLNFELMTSSQFLNMQKSFGQGYGATLTDAEIAALSAQTNTYWSDIFFRTGKTQSHDLSISTGSENMNSFSSISYFEQEGIFLGTNFKRFTLRNNVGGKSADGKFNYALNVNLNFSRSNGIDGAGSNAIYFAPFRAAMLGLPYLNPYEPDGSITHDGGIVPGDPSTFTPELAPYVLLNSVKMNTDIEDEFKILTSFNADYEFVKNVRAGVQLGVDYSHFQTLEILHPESILGPFQVDQDAQYGGIHEEASSRDFRFNAVTSLGYSNTFAEKHNFDITLYTEYHKAHYNGFNFAQRGLDPRLVGTGAAFIDGTTVDNLGVVGLENNQPYIPTVGSFNVEEGLFSYFGNMNYDYDGRYGLSATLRRDASFRFVEDNKWGTFWSVGARWNIDEESFMDNSAFNMLKMRASYGTAGNQRISNAQYAALSLTRSLYGSGTGYNGTVSTVATQIGNIDLQWEELAQFNVGVDWGLWNNRFTGQVDYYVKTTSELFDTRPISLVNATSAISANVGKMENRGIEVQMKYVVYDKNDWNVSVNGNFSYNKNKVLDLHESFDGLNFVGGATALGEGEAIGSFYVVEYAGVNPANGNPLFYKADGTLTETLNDADRQFTGKSVYPVWQGGFGTSIGYKGFDFNTQWTFLADVYRNNLDYAQLVETQSFNDDVNRSPDVLNVWQNPGDITDIPRLGSALGSVDYINSTDRFLEDASFLRLRNISLGYSFNQEQLKRWPVTGLRFFIQGENLVTFTKYRGWDAEAGFRTTDRGNYPTPRIYTFGASINF